MVLYGKSGNFIGIGKDELSFLGFDDIDEFKNEHKDFADLFISKPGYIFNFKNFSWIDYALHSGAPRKSVILKLKNGQEVETNLKISEIFLVSQTENETIHYCVELSNSAFKNFEQTTPTKTIRTEESLAIEPIFEQEFQAKIEPSEYIQQFGTPEIKTTPVEIDEPISYSLAEDFDDSGTTEFSDFKLKIEDDAYAQEYSSDTFPIEEEIEENPRKFDFDDSSIKLKIDFEEMQPPLQVLNKEEKLDFDIVVCAEELGLDLSEIAQIIEDLIIKIDKYLPQIKESIKENDTQTLKGYVIKIKGICDTLNMQQFSQKLEILLKEEDTQILQNTTLAFESLLTQLKDELI